MAVDHRWQVDDAQRYVAATVDVLATSAACEIFERGGSAIDAAIAANAVLSVTAPHLCGLGGDLLALVQTRHGATVLNASGRAGSQSDPESLRTGGHAHIPFRHHMASVTIPGCVDGWAALSQRFGRLHLSEVLEPAIHLAADGFDLGPLLFTALDELDHVARPRFDELTTQATGIGAVIKRPGIARTLAAIGTDGRDSFYLGEFGAGLSGLAGSSITAEDLSADQASWQDPLTIELWDHTIHAAGPNSQAYLVLATILVASAVGIPDDPDDPMWAHLLIEAALVAGHDRNEVLHEFADGRALLDAAAQRHRMIPMDRASQRRIRLVDGDTTAITTADADMAVSLIQSNAAGFGSWLVEPSTAINLHNRGIGFNLLAGHDNELRARRRPAHTLSPITFCSNDGSNVGSNVIGSAGTMGGDAQPQILAQILTRLLHHRQSPAEVLSAPRWSLRGTTAFDTWSARSSPTVMVEASSGWAQGLGALGHSVIESTGVFGHANLAWSSRQSLAAAGDPRSVIGAAAGR